VLNDYLAQVKLLLKRLLVGFAGYLACRILFFVCNLHFFSGTGFFSFLKDCFYGLRFDAFSLIASMGLFIVFSLIPSSLFSRRGYQRMLAWLFHLPNAIFLATNFIDTGYFAFTRKRATADLFAQLAGESDMSLLLPLFLVDYWWLALLFAILLYGLVKLYSRLKVLQVSYRFSSSTSGFGQITGIIFLFLLCLGFAVLGFRGGLQRIPVDVVNAGAVAPPDEVPIVLNTPFTLLKSLTQRSVPELQFFNEKELKAIVDPVHHNKGAKFSRENVVVLILESFSKEYTGLGGKISLTPFLDSLMKHSLVCTNAFSNGTKSIEGIPAILSSLPSLMQDPVINSIYANNRQTSFASLLGNEGYECAFFHGGINGTMNFTDWAPLAGYEHYYGKDEYGNDGDFDGYWGIWDEPFLQFAAEKMKGFRQPFHSAIFTLSSHHPYMVPEKYKNKFPEGPLENSASIMYADLSLRKFFEKVRTEPWYSNSLFVLTADHAGISEQLFFSNPVGNLTIPICFFRPDNSLTGKFEPCFSQMDILPTAMCLLGFEKPFFALGKDHFQSKHICCYYGNSSHNQYTDSLALIYGDMKLQAAYNYRRDSTLSANIVGKFPLVEKAEGAQLRAFIQLYNHTLIHNSGYMKN
jgi:glucan phosphoethanolaminetransferase (alkaline phosphatase superfamily)